MAPITGADKQLFMGNRLVLYDMDSDQAHTSGTLHIITKI